MFDKKNKVKNNKKLEIYLLSIAASIMIIFKWMGGNVPLWISVGVTCLLVYKINRKTKNK